MLSVQCSSCQRLGGCVRSYTPICAREIRSCTRVRSTSKSACGSAGSEKWILFLCWRSNTDHQMIILPQIQYARISKLDPKLVAWEISATLHPLHHQAVLIHQYEMKNKLLQRNYRAVFACCLSVQHHLYRWYYWRDLSDRPNNSSWGKQNAQNNFTDLQIVQTSSRVWEKHITLYHTSRPAAGFLSPRQNAFNQGLHGDDQSSDHIN